MPTASVILPARNEERTIAGCLTALLADGREDVDILVVDDASTDATRSIATSFEQSGRVRVFSNARRRGPATSLNDASRETDAEVLFFIDADCMPARGWVTQGLRSLRRPGVCAVEGAVHYDNPQPTFRHRIPINPFYNLARRGSLTVPGTDYANGNFAVYRTAFTAVGGFNAQRYGRGREDTDLGLRLRAHGAIEYNPEMKVTHAQGLWTFRDLLRNALRYEADVRIVKDHGDFHFRRRRILHPRFLTELCLPITIPFRYPMRSAADLLFVPQFYAYLVLLRLVIWRTAMHERVLLV